LDQEHLKVDLTGKTAIVTGGSRGIGRAISEALAQAGANVVIAARTEDDSTSLPGTIHKTTEDIKALGGNALAVRCDVTSAEDVKRMVETSIESFGAVDILINNAGALHGTSFLETEQSDFETIWRVNVLGPFLCSRAVLDHMMPLKRGSIVSISSGLSQSTHPGNNAYSASKAGLNRMMLKLSQEVVENNIAVNLLNPGFLRSEGVIAMVGSDVVDRIPPPSVAAPSAVWLAAQDAGFTGKIVDASKFGTEWP
jgi:NAD(P)-dependent dehydrogenase (short-subunit alcohol dehydrogenase family)